MFFGKTDNKNSGLLPTHPVLNPSPNPVWTEVSRLIWLASAILLLLALLSYSPTDPSWSTWTSRIRYSNWIGRTGSTTADLLYQFFGLGAFAIAMVFFAHAFTKARFVPEKGDHKFSWLGPVLFLLSASSLLQVVVPTKWTPWHLPNAGGMAGQVAIRFLTYLSGKVGAIFISVTATLATSIIVFRWKLVSTVGESISALFRKMTEFIPQKRDQFKAWMKGKREARRQAKLVKKIEADSSAIQKPNQNEVPNENPTPQNVSHPELAETGSNGAREDNGIAFGPSEGTDELIRAVTQTHRRLSATDNTKAKVRRKSNTAFALPQLNLVSGKAENKVKAVDKNWYLEKANILVQKLKDFGVEGEVVHISPGPVITVYEFKPASGVKIKEIANLSDDLTLALSVLSVRIVAPIPGKPVVGIEIPSPHRESVFFKDMVQETPFFKEEIRIPMALGRLASGEPVTADLAAMPHLLVAGTTGTGKSVFINTMISSFLYRFTPDQLKLILVDPKMVELSHYEGIPHLLLPVVVDSKKAALALRWTVDEMERRYSLMHQFGVRHLDSFNTRLNEYHKQGQALDQNPLPYIVVVIDEYADLMAVVPKDVELSIARLAQKARASGIHLVLATQRPSTDVVTGTIKANFPSRISFRVASSVDSKTILDRTGAERLLGQGDMLFHSAGFTTLKRMQGAFISDADIQRVVDHLKAQGEPEYDERILKTIEEQEQGLEDSDGANDGISGGSSEENRLYDAAVRIVAEKGEASISLIQRHLRIGYNRAAMLMERMEKEGVVAQSTGTSKRRAVIANPI